MVAELLHKGQQDMTSLQSILPRVSDLDQLISAVLSQVLQDPSQAQAEAAIQNLLKLRQSLTVAPMLAAALRDHDSAILSSIRNVCENPGLAEISFKIDEHLNADAVLTKCVLLNRTQVDPTPPHRSSTVARTRSVCALQKAFAVRPHIDGLLDVSRSVLCKSIEDLHTLAAQYAEECQIPLMKLDYAAKRGYHLKLPAEFEGNLNPAVFVQIIRQGKHVSCTTRQLESLNERLLVTSRRMSGITLS